MRSSDSRKSSRRTDRCGRACGRPCRHRRSSTVDCEPEPRPSTARRSPRASSSQSTACDRVAARRSLHRRRASDKCGVERQPHQDGTDAGPHRATAAVRQSDLLGPRGRAGRAAAGSVPPGSRKRSGREPVSVRRRSVTASNDDRGGPCSEGVPPIRSRLGRAEHGQRVEVDAGTPGVGDRNGTGVCRCHRPGIAEGEREVHLRRADVPPELQDHEPREPATTSAALTPLRSSARIAPSRSGCS